MMMVIQRMQSSANEARNTGILPVACVLARFDGTSKKQSRKRNGFEIVSLKRLFFQAALEVPEYRHARAGSTVLRAPPQTSLRRRRAFTFPELCIGMVVVSMVLGALAAFTLATAQAWNQGITTNAS